LAKRLLLVGVRPDVDGAFQTIIELHFL
jgi:hypothetical protein